MPHKNVEVIISGGGPVGMFLAIELRRHNRDVAVIERLAEPSAQIKAGSIGAQSARSLADRDLANKIEQVDLSAFLGESGDPSTDKGATRPIVGHFGGLWALRGATEETTAPIFASQHALETMLDTEAVAQGVKVLRRHELQSFYDDGAGHVRAQIAGPDGPLTLSAGYLVGCDGGRSLVRKQAGFTFDGTDATITGRQALVDIAEPNPLSKGWHRTEYGMVVYGPNAHRILTVEFDGPPADRESSVSRQEIENSLRRVSNTEVSVTAFHDGTRWTDNARLVDTYRRGRVLLAGDAAHVHPPFGGQGLNLGLQDAVDLGPKLAATLEGTAPDSLLDTYTTSRRPVAELALANTRAQVAIMRPDPQTTALRNLFAELLDFDTPNEFVSRRMAGYIE